MRKGRGAGPASARWHASAMTWIVLPRPCGRMGRRGRERLVTERSVCMLQRPCGRSQPSRPSSRPTPSSTVHHLVSKDAVEALAVQPHQPA